MSRLLFLLSWLGFPFYVWQGIGVRLRTERLLPARGPSSGGIEGAGEPARLLVIGDSSAASVGVDRTREGIAEQLSRLFSEATGRAVAWRAAGFNSATSAQIRDHVVPNLPFERWTHIVLSIGTNDAKNFHTARRFKKDFGGLLYALAARFPEARIVWSPTVDMRLVPALPRALGQVLEIRASLLNAMGRRLCLERGAIPAERLPIISDAGFSADGFHASVAGYRAWAEHILPLVFEKELAAAEAEPA